MKKILILFSAIVLSLAVSGCAGRCEMENCKNRKIKNELYCVEHTFSYEDVYSEVTITGYTGKNTKIEIPAEINGKAVTKIGHGAFLNFSALTSVNIPETVTEIAPHAFQECVGLSSLTIPESVQYIGLSAFSGCSGITSLEIRGNLVENGEYFKDMAGDTFAGCTQLKEIHLSEKLTRIYPTMFSGCTALQKISLHSNITNIGEKAFSACENLKEVEIHGNVESVGNGCFSGCTNLSSFQLHGSIRVIPNEMFCACSALTEFTAPETISAIGNGAFLNCENLQSITLHDNITEIGEAAFQNCKAISQVNLPKGLQSLGNYAFYGCEKITSMELPQSLLNIGECVFGGTRIESIVVPDLVRDFCADTIAKSSIKHLTLSGGITYFPSKCFKASALETIKIYGHITDMGASTFSGCKSLKSVDFVNGTDIISDSAFYECTSLSEVHVGATDSLIVYNGAFWGCDKLYEVKINAKPENCQWGSLVFNLSPGKAVYY